MTNNGFLEECIDGDEKRCRVYDASYPMFLTLSSGSIQFKHPDIVKYLTTFINISGYVKRMYTPM